ncbi:unnamed protein product [Pedinophyceae sp. YPF-701]|nr:unnamed protein product [Pedinophyceae sp. YPF-701]
MKLVRHAQDSGGTLPAVPGLIAVEGPTDARAVLRAVRATVLVSFGASALREGAPGAMVEIGKKFGGLVVLMDPDNQGRQIRNALEAAGGPLVHAFVAGGASMLDSVEGGAGAARGKEVGDMGVEWAPPDAIRKAIFSARVATPGRLEFGKPDLLAWGVGGLEFNTAASAEERSGAAARRRALGTLLGTGDCNGKQLLKQLNGFGFTREEVEAALEEVPAWLEREESVRAG